MKLESDYISMVMDGTDEMLLLQLPRMMSLTLEASVSLVLLLSSCVYMWCLM